MAVIPLPYLEPQGVASTDEWELRSITARQPSPLNGVATTLERVGASWATTVRYHNTITDKRARMQAFLSSCRGHGSRFYVPVYGWTRRGSFPAPELLTNNTFASGTGWNVASSVLFAMTASDGILRGTRKAHSNTADVFVRTDGPHTVTQYAPYAARSIDHQGNSSLFSFGPQLGSSSGAEDYGRANATTFGLKTHVAVLPATTAHYGLVDYNSGLNMAGHYIGVSYTSFARCALVDNGPNVFDQSDAIDHANWTKNNVTVTAAYYGAPDGSVTGERIIENGANSSHSIDRSFTKSATAQDWCATVAMRIGDTASERRYVMLRIDDGTSSNTANAMFDLLNGTISTAASVLGTFSNARAFIQSLGSSWYQCSVVGLTSTGTTIRCRVLLSNDGSALSYTGDSASNIGLWRVTMSQSSVPTRLAVTTSSADSDGTLQTGSGLHLKGLPASTDGLLLQGDPVEIITNTSTQLVRARKPLNSDASGLGYFEFEPPLRVSPLDNAAVIICNPLCRMMLDHNVVSWSEHDGQMADLEFTAVEDTYP